jgi:hypothetical protein
LTGNRPKAQTDQNRRAPIAIRIPTVKQYIRAAISLTLMFSTTMKDTYHGAALLRCHPHGCGDP